MDRTEYMKKFREKKPEDYNVMDIRTYFGQRYFHKFQIPAPPPSVILFGQLKHILREHSPETVCKVIRWMLRGDNINKLGKNVAPTLNTMIAFRDRMFHFALTEDRKAIAAENTKSVKKIKGKFQKSEVGW